MENNITCNFCNLSEPDLLTLSCSHSCCKGCFHKLCKYNESVLLDSVNMKKEEEEEELIFNCLICDKGSLKISKSVIYEILMTKRKDKEILFCKDHCDSQVEYFCSDCKWLMCSKCYNNHSSITAFRDHETTDNLNEVNTSYCKEHKKYSLSYQCLTCNIPICEICKKFIHNSDFHTLDTTTKYYNGLKESLQSKAFKSSTEVSEFFDKEELYLFEKQNPIIIKIMNEFDLISNNIILFKYTFNENYNLLNQETKFLWKILKQIYERITYDVKSTPCNDFLNINLLSKLTVEYDKEKVSCSFNNSFHDKFKSLRKDIESTIVKLENVKKMLSSDKIYKCEKVITNNEDSVQILIKLIDGRIASTSNALINIFDPQQNYAKIKTLQLHKGFISSLIQLKNGLLASASHDKTIILWDPSDSFKAQQILKSHTGEINALVELPGCYLVSGSEDKTINFWSSSNIFNSQTLSYNFRNDLSSPARSLAHFKKELLLSGFNDGKIRIWKKVNQLGLFPSQFFPSLKYEKLKDCQAHSDSVECLLELKNNFFASGSKDATLKIWNENLECVRNITTHTKSILALILLTDGTMASSSEDNRIILWDPNFLIKEIISTDNGTVNTLVELNQDGDIISGSSDKRIRIWKKEI